MPSRVNIDVDWGALRRLLGAGGSPLVDQMVLLFLRHTPDRLSLLRTGTETGDWASAERAAHSMKSTAAYLGLLELRARAEEAEVLAREGRGPELQSLLNGLDRAFSAVRGDLPRIVRQLSAL
ncbi:MAG TPA: Hpt domain-containing protein [Planctomycetota bacterium]|nr:Hpt domain-containing protein [Planctomycetota bacterium]